MASKSKLVLGSLAIMVLASMAQSADSEDITEDEFAGLKYLEKHHKRVTDHANSAYNDLFRRTLHLSEDEVFQRLSAFKPLLWDANYREFDLPLARLSTFNSPIESRCDDDGDSDDLLTLDRLIMETRRNHVDLYKYFVRAYRYQLDFCEEILKRRMASFRSAKADKWALVVDLDRQCGVLADQQEARELQLNEALRELMESRLASADGQAGAPVAERAREFADELQDACVTFTADLHQNMRLVVERLRSRLEKRAAILSERPDWARLEHACSWTLRIGFDEAISRVIEAHGDDEAGSRLTK